jgi:hypothetical protein
VRLLLYYADVNDAFEALLMAISMDHEDITLMIIRHNVYRKIYSSLQDGTQMLRPDSQFSSAVSPLCLAAARNQFQVVSMLVKGKSAVGEPEVITDPHSYNCSCETCYDNEKSDALRTATVRLETYRALASEAYIALTESDPIRRAFQLARNLRVVSHHEKHYQVNQ